MRPAGLALLAALAACQRSAEPPPEQQWSWTKAPDGSVFMYADREAPMGPVVHRCWEKRGKYDCLGVSYIPGIGYSMSRYAAKLLPEKEPANGPGYGCQYSDSHDMITEAIGNERGVLLENRGFRAGWDHHPWPATFVKTYMRSNALNVQSPYFACEAVVKLLAKGSAATITTTSIKYDEVML